MNKQKIYEEMAKLEPIDRIKIIYKTLHDLNHETKIGDYYMLAEKLKEIPV